MARAVLVLDRQKKILLSANSTQENADEESKEE